MMDSTIWRRFFKAMAAVGLFATLLAVASPCKAEIITLVDDSKVYGKIVHYYDGTLTIQAANDVELKLPVEKVKSIRFKLPKPRPEFATPAKTFKKYQRALAKGRIQQLIECFSLQYQTMMMHQLAAMSLKDLNQMRQAVKSTSFKIKSTKYKGDVAFLLVEQTQGNRSVTAKIQFVKENEEWKMVPGQGPLPAGAGSREE